MTNLSGHGQHWTNDPQVKCPGPRLRRHGAALPVALPPKIQPQAPQPVLPNLPYPSLQQRDLPPSLPAQD